MTHVRNSMLVDIALHAIAPAVNFPTIMHMVINRLTNLLLTISRQPELTGAFTDLQDEIRFFQPVFSWKDYVDLTFSEVLYFRTKDPQTHTALVTSFEFLLENVSDEFKPALEAQMNLL